MCYNACMKTKIETWLLGSSGSLESLLEMTKKYYYNETVEFTPVSEKEWSVKCNKGEMKSRVIKKARRYRLELVRDII